MDRDPTDTVKRELRREVGYGCSVPDCAEPFLSWHHFDPPWSVREHHEPAGMIALCRKHHDMADAGTYSPEQLRNWKQCGNNRSSVEAKFEWMPARCLMRFGGCYCIDRLRMNRRDNQSFIELGRNTDGMQTLSFRLTDRDGNVAGEMTENSLSAHVRGLHDLEISTSGNRIKIWFGKRDIGFEFLFRRLTLQRLDELLHRDEVNALRACGEDIDPNDTFLVTRNPKQQYDRIKSLPTPAAAAEFAQSTWQPVSSMIVRWHALKLLGSDGTVPVLT